MARFIAMNISVEPTEMPCTLARREKIRPGLSSVAPPLKPPIMRDFAADADGVERARQRRRAADLDHVIDARPPVNSSAAFSQSGVVL